MAGEEIVIAVGCDGLIHSGIVVEVKFEIDIDNIVWCTVLMYGLSRCFLYILSVIILPKTFSSLFISLQTGEQSRTNCVFRAEISMFVSHFLNVSVINLRN